LLIIKLMESFRDLLGLGNDKEVTNILDQSKNGK
jgi:hypothetical protein